MKGILLTNKWSGLSTEVPVSWPQRNQGYLALCLGGPLRIGAEEKSYPSTEMSIISFLEMQKLLGVNKVFFYGMQVPNVTKNILEYYRKDGILDYTEWNFPIGDNERFRYFGQNLLIHDCIFRTRGAFTFTMVFDLDESIIPHKHKTLVEMLQTRKENKTSGFAVRNTFFHTHWNLTPKEQKRIYKGYAQVPEIPEAIYLHEDVQRKWKYGQRGKYIVHPERVRKMRIHNFQQSIWDHHEQVLPLDIAQLHHHRPFVHRKGDKGSRGKQFKHTRIDENFVHTHLNRLIPAVETTCQK